MGVPRQFGFVALLLGLLLLVVGSVVLAVVPDWGQWLRDYPQQAQAQPIPDQMRPVAQVMLGFVLGPLLQQVGGWLRSVGYFVGTVIVLVSLFPLGGGLAILAGRRRGYE
jgi:amino acid transporter